MAQIIQKISVEVSKPNFFQAIVAKQYDNNSRFLKVTLLHEGSKIEVESKSTVTINAKRNDGKTSSFKGKVNDDGTVTVPVNFWMLELAGTLYCDVSVIGTDESKLTTSKFIIEVEEASATNGDISTEIITSIVTVVPFEKGGTNAETVAGARQNLNYLGKNPVTKDTDTPSTWIALGSGTAYITELGHITDQPYNYGFIESMVSDTGLIKQIWHNQTGKGSIFKRAGTRDGWYADSWTEVFDSKSYIPTVNGGVGANPSVDIGQAEHLECVNRFVAEMNRVAEKIGMSNSSFKSPSGLYSNSVHEKDAITSTAYNSKSTVKDIIKLMIAARHTPAVLAAMGASEYSCKLNSQNKTYTHLILNKTAWSEWANKNNYTIIAAKGGSCSGEFGGIGICGIYNMTMLLKDTSNRHFCVAVMGMQNPTAWEVEKKYNIEDRVTYEGNTYVSKKDNNTGIVPGSNSDWTLEDLSESDKTKAIFHELIQLQKNKLQASDATEINKAKSRKHPASMMVVELPATGTFKDDIAKVNDATCYKGYNIDNIEAMVSIAKVLTALVVVSHLENHYVSVNYDDFVGGSSIVIEVGDVMTTYDAFNVMMLRSCNTLSTMFARIIGKRL